MANDSIGLVMYDNDYIAAANYIENYCSSLNGIINAYIITLQDITEGAIVDANISSRLAKLSNSVAPLMQTISDIGEQVSQESRNFVTGIDLEDSFLY